MADQYFELPDGRFVIREANNQVDQFGAKRHQVDQDQKVVWVAVRGLLWDLGFGILQVVCVCVIVRVLREA